MCKLKVGFVDLWDYYFRPVIFRIKLFDSTLPKRPLRIRTESRLFSRANFKNDRGSSIHACHQSFPIREFRSLTNFCRGPLSASVWPRSRYANALLSHERFQPVTLFLLLSRLSIPKGSFSRLSLMSPRASSLQSPAIPTRYSNRGFAPFFEESVNLIPGVTPYSFVLLRSERGMETMRLRRFVFINFTFPSILDVSQTRFYTLFKKRKQVLSFLYNYKYPTRWEIIDFNV